MMKRMNIATGYGAIKRTRTHVISCWTDGARTYAHAKPLRGWPRRTVVPPKREFTHYERLISDAKLNAESEHDHEKVSALDELLRALFNWQFEPKYEDER